MNGLNLSNSQREILTTLVNEYQQTESPVKADQIATVLDLDPRSIRNAMQGLKALNAVEGVPGPKGGYEPTENAFAALGRDPLDEQASVTLSQNFERVPVTVESITFPNVFHPEECTARVHFRQSVQQVSIGDAIAVGPTPLSNLVVAGPVEWINSTADEVLVDVAVAEAPLVDE